MNFDLKEEIRAYWSARAENFDESPSHLIEERYGLPEWQTLIRRAAGVGDTGDLQGKRALDIACGTGEISRVLCRLGAEVSGLDFSETMLGKAREKLTGQNWSPVLCDAEDLKGVPDESVDFAITRHLTWTLTNPLDAYCEWHRVLKPGGRMLINDHNFSLPFSTWHRLKKRLANLLKPSSDGVNIDAEANAAIRERLYYKGGLTKERLIEDMQSCGFAFQEELDLRPIYSKGMQTWPMAERLRQSAENRYSLVFEKAL
ncbi:class I SAM-dependent methyltransferase [Yoonia sp. BS5-3]|uniref:Class I SAM-dependent methyltransferase n=1 Tax=Yoonia phaeophyticola TaxID=3137369 RepID=A0ABZ2V680_9RHOB